MKYSVTDLNNACLLAIFWMEMSERSGKPADHKRAERASTQAFRIRANLIQRGVITAEQFPGEP